MANSGLGILVRSMSIATGGFAYGNRWQYHPRSDRHSKILCWAVFFDLMRRQALIAAHVANGRVGFGINHTMNDFQHDRKKNLDLVICKRGDPRKVRTIMTFADMVPAYDIRLTNQERNDLAGLPKIPLTGVLSSLVALEAKACMTEFGKARPRLYDELNSSHLTIHGDTDSAVAAGFVLVNAASTFVSPLRAPFTITDANPAPVTRHTQPGAASSVVEKITQLPRRSHTGVAGFDALGLALIDCANDLSAVTLVAAPPAPQPGDVFHYDNFIDRIETIYATRFSGL